MVLNIMTKQFFKIVPMRAYLVISTPLVCLSLFFSLFKYQKFTALSIFIGVLLLATILLLVNWIYYKSETSTPSIRLADGKLEARIKDTWVYIDRDALKIDLDNNRLQFNNAGEEIYWHFRKEDLLEIRKMQE